jgi:hypothetical protein
VSGQLRASAVLPPGKDPRYPLDRRLDGPRAVLDVVEKKKIPSLPPRIETPNPDRPARSNKKAGPQQGFEMAHPECESDALSLYGLSVSLIHKILPYLRLLFLFLCSFLSFDCKLKARGKSCYFG